MLLVALAAGCAPGSDASRGPAPAPSDAPQVVAAEPTPVPEADEPPTTEPPAEPPAEPPEASDEPDPLSWPAARSTSIGHPARGRLEGGVPLPLTAPGLLLHPGKDPGSRFGTVELVQGLLRATAAVERADPGAPLTVGDLSREAGGDIPGHASHRTGRDVDVLFHLRHDTADGEGEPFVPAKAIPLDPEGRGTDYGDLADPSDDVPVRIDLARTWAFVAALLADDAAAVQRIFIVEHLRGLLLEEAARVEAPAEVIERFADVTCQPRFPHDDHMHIRVFCSLDDVAAGCEDTPPMYPWRKQALAAAGVEPGRAEPDGDEDPAPARGKTKPKLKTLAQARAEAGPMHEDVVAFLDRREAWAKQPHPGRRFCR